MTRTGDAQAVQTVQFTTVDNTAVTTGSSGAGTFDYNPNSGTLTFSQGQSVQTISVTAVPDTVTEGNEAFNVVLSNSMIGGGAGGSITNATASGIITDDDGQVIRAEALDVIGADLEQLYDTLDARDLAAGSALARRLFS